MKGSSIYGRRKAMGLRIFRDSNDWIFMRRLRREFTVEGANLIRLDYKPKGVSLLHCTEDETALRTQKIYGIPLLFFPNRIKDGTFTFEGKEYHFRSMVKIIRIFMVF